MNTAYHQYLEDALSRYPDVDEAKRVLDYLSSYKPNILSKQEPGSVEYAAASGEYAPLFF